MYIPLPLLILAGLAFLVLLVLVMRQRGRADDLVAVPRSRVQRVAPPAVQRLELTAEKRAEVDQLLGDGQVIDAIKLVREATGSGLKDAKDAVDEMRRSVPSAR